MVRVRVGLPGDMVTGTELNTTKPLEVRFLYKWNYVMDNVGPLLHWDF